MTATMEARMQTQEAMTLAMTSVLSCLISELQKKDSLDVAALVENIQLTAIEKRKTEFPLVAKMMEMLANYVLASVPGPNQ